MSLIEQATKRLEQLERAGVAVPWAAARTTRGGEARLPNALPAEDQNAALVDKTIPQRVHLRTAESCLKPAAKPAAKPVTKPADQSSARSHPISLQAASLQAAATQTFASQSALQAEPAARAEPRRHVTLDLEMLRSAGYLVPDQVRSEMAQQFRHMKRPLLKTARLASQASGERAALIMVTSAVPGEGKTFCAINLAMSMAMEVDTGVILVDADVVRPSVFSRFGIDAQAPGLLDLLTRSDLILQDALVSTNVPKLCLMSAGNRNDRSTELLASDAMDRLLVQLTQEYADHLVIFDAPPVLLTTESSVLATKVGQVVVVVESSKTSRNSVQQAFAALSHCPVVVSVLNKCEIQPQRYGYHYG
jgi:protein-tyrosine kinase